MPSQMTCPFCGTAVSQEARYCDRCGTPLSQAGLPALRRGRPRPSRRIAIWAFLTLVFLVFGSGLAGGFRYQAGRWPWAVPAAAFPGAAPRAGAPGAAGSGGSGLPVSGAADPAAVTQAPPQRPKESNAATGYLRSVVAITARTPQGVKTGSGFLVDGQGHVLTVAHVVEGVTDCVTVVDDNGKSHQGKVIARESNVDAALVSVPGLISWPAFLEPGTSAALQPGDLVYVMGSPKGAGHATFLPAEFSRKAEGQRIEGRYFKELLQVGGAAVLEGSSGGPLVHRGTGRAVGVVNAGTSAQLAYAIPMSEVAPLLETWMHIPNPGACTTGLTPATVPVILAAITPLSGPSGVWGADLADGAALALRDMEPDLRRTGYEVTLKKYDDQGSLAAGAEAARSAEYDQGVIGVVGSLDSQITGEIGGVLARSSLTLVAPVAGADYLAAQNWGHFNRVVANARRQEQAVARFALEKLKAGSLYVLEDGTVDAGIRARNFETAAQVLALPVVGRGRLEAAPDFAQLRRTVEESRAGAIFFAGRSEAAVAALQGLREAGVTLPFLGGDTLYDQRLAALPQGVAGGVYFTLLTAEAGEQFQRHFESALGRPGRGYGAYGYDAARLILEALVRYGDAHPGVVPSRPELAALVRQSRGYLGWSGPVTFDETGENRSSWVYVYEWKQGNPELREQLK